MHDIEIMVEPRYVAEQSNMMKDRYVFSYHIVIVNRGEEPDGHPCPQRHGEK